MSEELFRLAQTRDGAMLYNPRGMYIGAALERYGEFSYFELELFARSTCSAFRATDRLNLRSSAKSRWPHERWDAAAAVENQALMSGYEQGRP